MLTRKQRNGLIVICTGAFLVPFMGSAINLALPFISEELDMSAISLTWLSTAYLLSAAILQIPFARLADLFGRRKIFIIGIFLFAACTFISGFANSGPALITMRILSGIGAAMMFGTNIAILTSLFPGEQRGKALGYNTAVVYAALAIGPLIGGVITQHLSWHYIFFITGVATLIVFIMAITLLKGEWIVSKGEKFDFIGSILYGIGLATTIYGFTNLSSLKGIISMTIGVISLTVFILYEKKQKYPVFNIKLFTGNKVFTYSSIAAFINYAATFAITFMLSLYLQYVRGFDPSKAGLILICQVAIQSVFSIISGNISSRIAPQKLATAGMGLIVIGLFGLIFLTDITPIYYIIGILILLGIGFGIFSAPNTNVIMGSVEKRYYSQASAITGTMRQTGQSVSMGIASMAIAFSIGESKITPDLHSAFLESMRLTFIIFIVLCILGLFASTARNKTTENSAY